MMSEKKIQNSQLNTKNWEILTAIIAGDDMKTGFEE